jgi:uncharacterized protein (DUF1778 family)
MRRSRGDSPVRIVKDLNPTLKGWFGYFQHRAPGVFGYVDGFVRRRVRAILHRPPAPRRRQYRRVLARRMAFLSQPQTRDINRARVRSEDRNLIDRAARLLGKSRTDFLLETARRAAQDALLDQTLFRVSPSLYAEFVARLDAPPAANDRLRRTMTTPAPWE